MDLQKPEQQSNKIVYRFLGAILVALVLCIGGLTMATVQAKKAPTAEQLFGTGGFYGPTSNGIASGSDVTLGSVTSTNLNVTGLTTLNTSTVNGPFTVNGSFSFTTGSGVITNITSTNIYTQSLTVSSTNIFSIATNGVTNISTSTIRSLALGGASIGASTTLIIGNTGITSRLNSITNVTDTISVYHTGLAFVSGPNQESVLVHGFSNSLAGNNAPVFQIARKFFTVDTYKAIDYTNQLLFTFTDTGFLGAGTAVPSSSVQLGIPLTVNPQFLQIATMAAASTTPATASCVTSTLGRMIFNATSTAARQKLWICGMNSGAGPTWTSSTLFSP